MRLQASPIHARNGIGDGRPYVLRRRSTRTPQPRDAAQAAVRRQAMKGSEKPKKMGKKPAQKSLKEKRTEKRAAAKQTRSLGS